MNTIMLYSQYATDQRASLCIKIEDQSINYNVRIYVSLNLHCCISELGNTPVSFSAMPLVAFVLSRCGASCMNAKVEQVRRKGEKERIKAGKYNRLPGVSKVCLA